MKTIEFSTQNINAKMKLLFIPLLVSAGLINCNQHTKSDKVIKQVHKPTIEWVSIPAGTFLMGSPENEPQRMVDEKQHRVTLSGFKMSKYETTFEQYDRFCDATGRAKPDDLGMGRGNRPVINVSWIDASEFAIWMDCRLPTEAEWEYACRAGTITPFSTGNTITTDQANFNGTVIAENKPLGQNRKITMPVGSFAPNAWGLYDMHGNVSEWCSDRYGEYSTDSKTNPKGPHYVIRGCNWYDIEMSCRSASRNYSVSDEGISGVGFRLVSGK
jgi:sulfatase modifying factor 1